jgi:hypothetical protein
MDDLEIETGIDQLHAREEDTEHACDLSGLCADAVADREKSDREDAKLHDDHDGVRHVNARPRGDEAQHHVEQQRHEHEARTDRGDRRKFGDRSALHHDDNASPRAM